jgi:hypothetical protein
VQPNLIGQMSPVSANFVHQALNASDGMGKKLTVLFSEPARQAQGMAPNRRRRVHFKRMVKHWLLALFATSNAAKYATSKISTKARRTLGDK